MEFFFCETTVENVVQYIFYSGPGRLGVHKKLPTKLLSKSHIDGTKE